MENDASSQPLLGKNQRKLVAFAATLAAIVAIFLLLALALIGFSKTITFFSSVLWPLAVAGILALILRPVVGLLQERLKIGRFTAVILLFTTFTLALGGVLLALVPALITQTLDFIDALPELWQRAVISVQNHYPRWIAYGQERLEDPTFKKFVEDLARTSREFLAAHLPSIKTVFGQIMETFGFAVGLAIIPVYLFFFLLNDFDLVPRLRGFLPFVKTEIRDDIVFLVKEFVGIVVAFFRGQILISAIMGILYGVGFSLAGLKFGLVIGLGMGLLNIVPYLGTILGLAIALPIAFFQPEGGLALAGIVLGVFAFTQVIEGWVLTPKIMGHQTGLHPVVIIISVFFWGVALGGLLGMVLAIPLTAFIVTAWRLLRRKYFTA